MKVYCAFLSGGLAQLLTNSQNNVVCHSRISSRKCNYCWERFAIRRLHTQLLMEFSRQTISQRDTWSTEEHLLIHSGSSKRTASQSHLMFRHSCKDFYLAQTDSGKARFNQVSRWRMNGDSELSTGKRILIKSLSFCTIICTPACGRKLLLSPFAA